jgi:LuxR family maltose regulon positive regulatory protein
MNAGLHTKLTLISAPAGFGKTTLVIDWLESLRFDSTNSNQIEHRFAWLSLDEEDNDLTRFLTYFITALRQFDEQEPGFGSIALGMLQSPQAPPIDVVLTSLINEIVNIPFTIIYVLDDFHHIDNQQVQEAVAFLLENTPPQFHLVLTTREDPMLPLPRLRARGQLNELRAADLRFSLAEAAEFLNQVMGLDLSDDEINALEMHTEGWIAGLQLAAISMRGYVDMKNFIDSFTGSHRLVLDYLVEEVFKQQSEHVQLFLLQTSILERMNGSLCDALTGFDDGQESLESLERTNLFVIPLDNERQ